MIFKPGDLIYYIGTFSNQKPFYEVTRSDKKNNKVWVKSSIGESWFHVNFVALYEPMTICKKIKQMEVRWKNFQTRKASSIDKNTLTATF